MIYFSDGPSVHHQESKTVHTSYHTGSVAASKQPQNL